MKIAINGFGRIGKTFLRTVLLDASAKKKLLVVAINLGFTQKTNADILFKYDTLMGVYPGDVSLEGDTLVIDGMRIALLGEVDPAQLPWKAMGIDWVVEASGHFTKRDGAQKHITAGAKKVLITAPSHGEDVAIVPGVNDGQYKPEQHHIVSLGSCTTNAFLPTLKCMHDAFTISQCLMTTVHAYTNTQVLLDVDNGDPRRSRAAALNIVPTSSGASEMIDKVMPQLKGRVSVSAMRVPVGKVSLIDMTCITEKPVSVESINQLFAHASERTLAGVVAFTKQPLVSSDFGGTSCSVTIDGLLTATQGDYISKIFGWYDNEFGYSCRLRDFLLSRGAGS